MWTGRKIVDTENILMILGSRLDSCRLYHPWFLVCTLPLTCVHSTHTHHMYSYTGRCRTAPSPIQTHTLLSLFTERPHSVTHHWICVDWFYVNLVWEKVSSYITKLLVFIGFLLLYKCLWSRQSLSLSMLFYVGLFIYVCLFFIYC